MCVYCTTEPCGPLACVALPFVCSGTVDPTQRQSYTTDEKKKKREWGSERKEERINQARRKTKATGQGGPKCHLASTWGEKKGGEKEKRKSRVYQRKVLFLFLDSWVSYYGIRFNQCPPRNVEQRAGGNGWKSFLGDDVGRVLRRRGGPGCGVGCR